MARLANEIKAKEATAEEAFKSIQSQIESSVTAIQTSVRTDQRNFMVYLSEVHRGIGVEHLKPAHINQLVRTATQLAFENPPNTTQQGFGGTKTTSSLTPEWDMCSTDSDDLSYMFFDCVSTLSSITHEELRRTSLDLTLERSSNYFPEAYTTEAEYGPRLFVYSRVNGFYEDQNSEMYTLHFSQNSRHWIWITFRVDSLPYYHWILSMIPPGINGRMIEAPKAARDELQELIYRGKSHEDFVSDSIAAEKPSAPCISRSRIRIIGNNNLELRTTDVDGLNCPQFLETEVIIQKRCWHNCFSVLVERKRYFYRLLPPFFSTASFRSQRLFMHELQALYAVRNVPLILQLAGVVFDDCRRQVKGYLLSHLEKMTPLREKLDLKNPWPVRELWARQIVSSVNQLHCRGFAIGLVDLTCFILDADDNAHLIFPMKDEYLWINAYGDLPPEFRTCLKWRQQSLDLEPTVEADLFALGMLLWLLANDKPAAVTAVFCKHAGCENRPYTRCELEHVNPVGLPPVDDLEVPEYFQGIIATCRSRSPICRKPAAELLRRFLPEPELRLAALHTIARREANVLRNEYEGVPTRCDECDEVIPGGSYRCDICNKGDFDLCVDCAEKGLHCLDDSHVLVWEEQVGDELVRSSRIPTSEGRKVLEGFTGNVLNMSNFG